MAGVVAAGLLAWLWCLVAVRIGPRIGYVDRPDESGLKVHQTPAVPLGGVGVFIGLVAAGLINGDLDVPVLAATSIVVVLGLVDDRWGLPPVLRLAVELVASGVLVFGLVGFDGSPTTIGLGLVLVVFAINAVNLFDGLDGLASSVGLVAAVGIAVLSSLRGLENVTEPLALAAGLAGFLVLGWHPARVFLGDAGAYLIGTVLAATILRASPGGGADLLIAAAILLVFATDLIVAVLRRLRSGRPLFEGDRSHVYDQLRDRGLGVTRVVYLAVSVQILVAALVIAVDRGLGGWIGVAVIGAVWLTGIGLLARSGFVGSGTADPH